MSVELYASATRSLSRREPRLRALIKQVGPCRLTPIAEPFPILVRTIISQQLSTRAAMTIGDRLAALLPNGFTPDGIAELTDDQIRGCGLSGGKLKSIRDLCSRIACGTLKPEQFPSMPDEELRTALTEVHGIGPWSVDMYLIFCLGRTDVWPIGDLGVRDVFQLPEVPSPQELMNLAEPWRPYRTIAAWYFWRSRGFVPQSDDDARKSRSRTASQSSVAGGKSTKMRSKPKASRS